MQDAEQRLQILYSKSQEPKITHHVANLARQKKTTTGRQCREDAD